MTVPLEVTRVFARRRLAAFAVLGALLAMTAVSALVTKFDFGLMFSSLPKAAAWMAARFVPGEKAVRALPQILQKLGETVLVSVMATVIAAALALAFAILASRTTRPAANALAAAAAVAIRGLASFCRNVPVVAWAMILLLALGQNSITGLLALLIGTFGYLTRAFTETIDEVAESSVEALRASGAGWSAIVTRAVIPSVLPSVASWMLYMVETNIRDATLVGLLTGTGIGFLFDRYYKVMNFEVAGAVVIGIIVTVILVEALSNILRRAFL
jgi:phosphonate transport system permease protein